MMHTWTDEQKQELDRWLDAGLCRGKGNAESRCVMAAVRAALDPSASISDHVDCVHPVLRSAAIRLNDSRRWSPTSRSDGLRELAIAMPGTSVLDTKALRDGLVLLGLAAADRAVRVDAVAALRRAGLEAQAAGLEALPALTKGNARGAAAAAHAADAYAAADAAYAYAAAHAAVAADAAADAAYADAADADAAYAAHAAAHAAHAADAADAELPLRAFAAGMVALIQRLHALDDGGAL